MLNLKIQHISKPGVVVVFKDVKQNYPHQPELSKFDNVIKDDLLLSPYPAHGMNAAM